MYTITPFKVEFIDIETNEVENNLWNIVVELDIETNELHAYMLSETPEFDKELQIRIKE